MSEDYVTAGRRENVDRELPALAVPAQAGLVLEPCHP